MYYTNQTSFFRLFSVFFTGETYLVREFWLFIFISHDASRNKSDEYDKKSLFAVRRLGSVSHARSQELKITLGIILGSLIDFIFWRNQTYDFNIHIIWYDNYSKIIRKLFEINRKGEGIRQQRVKLYATIQNWRGSWSKFGTWFLSRDKNATEREIFAMTALIHSWNNHRSLCIGWQIRERFFILKILFKV